jgi:hypothetical protein
VKSRPAVLRWRLNLVRDYYDSLYASGCIETLANHERPQHKG